MKWKKNRGTKNLSRLLDFYKKSEDKYKEVNLQDANILKKTFFIVLSNIKSILVFVCILAFIWTIIAYVGSFGKRTVLLSLNYEEASKGQNPNQTRYNVFELKSDEVMQRVIEYAGLQDDITVEELADRIDISENNNDKTIDPLDTNTYYISTSYTITYDKSNKIKNISTDDMMNIICKAYNDWFHEEYVGAKTVLQYDLGDINGMEYIEIARLLTK